MIEIVWGNPILYNQIIYIVDMCGFLCLFTINVYKNYVMRNWRVDRIIMGKCLHYVSIYIYIKYKKRDVGE